MSDITKCKGGNCPVKETCYRYLAKANNLYQSYFVDAPYTESVNDCEEYWPDESEEEGEAK